MRKRFISSVSFLLAMVALLLLSPLLHAELPVTVQRGGLADFLGERGANEALEKMILDQYDPLVGFEIPFDLARFAPAEQRRLFSSVVRHESRDWLVINQGTFSLLQVHSPEYKAIALKIAAGIFARLFPIAYPSVDVPGQTKELSRSFVVNAIRPDFRKYGVVGADQLLSRIIPEFKFHTYGPPGTGDNCAGWAISALSVAEPPVHLDYGFFAYKLERHFQEVSPPLLFGDLIYFEFDSSDPNLANDFHAMIYVGSEASTSKWIVFTKNGQGAIPSLFMAYEDVYRFYQSRTRFKAVRYYRLVDPI